MKQIKLTQGKFALVDDEDFDLLNQWKWCFDASNGYAMRNERINGKNKHWYMHHVLLPEIERGRRVVDHADRNKLNNQRSNLRYCSHSDNLKNQEIRSSSGLRGVRFLSRNTKNPYHAYIAINKRQKHLGYFSTEAEAVEAYNAAARAESEFRILNEAIGIRGRREGRVNSLGQKTAEKNLPIVAQSFA